MLEERAFERCVEEQCERFYAETMGRPSLAPGRYFRLLLIGYFEGIEGERGIAWRAADSPALRQFLELERSPGGSLDDLSYAAADRCGNPSSGIRLGAGVAGREGVAEGQDGGHRCHQAGSERRPALDCASGYRRGYEESLRRLAEASGIATPTREQLAKLDRKRVNKGSNEDWVNPHDPEAGITKL